MQQPTTHQQHISDDDPEDRRNRFLDPNGADQSTATLRERAASQPPRSSSDQLYASSPSHPQFIPSSLGGSATALPWSTQLATTGFSANNRSGLPQSVPTRSSSFSNPQQANFYSAMRESRAFASTFEDDESEAFSDTYDELYIPTTMSSRGRTYATDPSRSRSQSLATSRPGAIGSHFQGLSIGPGWQDTSHPLNIPGSRYGEIKPPGTSRYGSLGTLGRSPNHIHSSSPSGGSVVGNGFSNRQTADVSNMSPFMRDVGQILLDDGSSFRDLWSGMNPPRNENGGNSGTTSRRHSVSVVQPRRGGSNVVGFSAPGNDGPDEPARPFQTSTFGRGGLMLTDDDLASDLNMLTLSPRDKSPSSASRQQQHHHHNPPSQPASLPIYAPPLSHSPPSTDRISPYQSINLTIPKSSYTSRQTLGSPTDSGLSPGGNSPTRYDPLSDTPYFPQKSGAQGYSSSGHQSLSARFIPGQGIQYLPTQTIGTGFGNHNNNGMAIGGGTGNNNGSGHSNGLAYGRARAPSYTGGTNIPPLSPSSTRAINPQQPPYYPQQIQRRPSDSSQSPLTELGKGVPLHAVPASWPLFIVEFKAGRTDLFYLTDLSLDIRVGDLVIVEADRGKDLGKVVNDSITLAEVEAFQKQQQARIGYGDGQPTSPGGNPSSSGTSGKKEINPKKIYGKAQQQDTQLLLSKIQDEVKALQLCQSKVRAKKLPMEVIDAEYQWDRRKLTFYFVAEKRIDFRELVRELFRLYKTRIWMASLQGSTPSYDQ